MTEPMSQTVRFTHDGVDYQVRAQLTETEARVQTFLNNLPVSPPYVATWEVIADYARNNNVARDKLIHVMVELAQEDVREGRLPNLKPKSSAA
jgi:hypothetical protein